MLDERERIIAHILDIDKRVYQYLQVSRIPEWAGVELTMPQLKVLFLAGGPRPVPTSQAARSLGMTLSTATGVVDRLVAHGLVQRLEDPTDRRVVLLQATAEGTATLERLLHAGLGHFRSILDRLSLEELRIVSHALDLLHEAAMSTGDTSVLDSIGDTPNPASKDPAPAGHPRFQTQHSALSTQDPSS